MADPVAGRGDDPVARYAGDVHLLAPDVDVVAPGGGEIKRFRPMTDPEAPEVVEAIEAVLEARFHLPLVYAPTEPTAILVNAARSWSWRPMRPAISSWSTRGNYGQRLR